MRHCPDSILRASTSIRVRHMFSSKHDVRKYVSLPEGVPNGPGRRLLILALQVLRAAMLFFVN